MSKEHTGLSDHGYTVVGSSTSVRTWVYLCGLTQDFHPVAMHNVQIIDEVGKNLDIKFLAIRPQYRSPQFNNRLCWPHDTQESLLKTYQEINTALGDTPIEGYIGFSNGGFFLNKLTQFIAIDKPIISIGSGGPVYTKNGPHNNMYLLISKDDIWHYQSAINLYEASKKTNLTIELIEYEGGHQVPQQTLEDLLGPTNKL